MVAIGEQKAAYDASRERISALVRGLDAEELRTTVTCCPAWTVEDLLGHLAGVLEDRAAAKLPSRAFAEWTDAQVARHRGQPVAEVLDAWWALPVDETDAAPSLATLSFDAVTHEHDLCEALGRRGDRSSDAVRVGSSRAEERMAAMLGAAGAPCVVLTTEDGTRELSEGSARIALSASRFGFMRLVTGRMSRAQATAMGWDADPSPVLDALFADGFFTLQPADVPNVDRV